MCKSFVKLGKSITTIDALQEPIAQIRKYKKNFYNFKNIVYHVSVTNNTEIFVDLINL